MKKIGILIFIIAIALGVALANVFSFGKTTASFLKFQIDFGRVKGSGNIISEKREVPSFDSIEAHGALEIEVVAQQEFSVEVTGDDNLLQYIRTDVRGSKLDISSEKNFSTKGRIKLKIGAPNVEMIDLSGATIATVSNIKNESFRIESSGASKVKLSGETRNLVIDLSGASKVDATELKAVNANVDGSGACSANVFVSGELIADLSGASHVSYSGNPTSVKKDVSGASSVNGN